LAVTDTAGVGVATGVGVVTTPGVPELLLPLHPATSAVAAKLTISSNKSTRRFPCGDLRRATVIEAPLRKHMTSILSWNLPYIREPAEISLPCGAGRLRARKPNSVNLRSRS
jgi:hypothetical protein